MLTCLENSAAGAFVRGVKTGNPAFVDDITLIAITANIITEYDKHLGSSHYSDSHYSDSYFSDTHNSDSHYADTH